MPALHRLLLASPVGPLFVTHDGAAVRSLAYWPQGTHPPAGTRRAFDLPLAPEGTAFQRRVWAALGEIPFGATRTYGDVADAVGCRAARAIGQANRRNPIPIVIPCHRVLAAGGIGGYAGQAGAGARVDTKRWLLRHEGVDV